MDNWNVEEVKEVNFDSYMNFHVLEFTLILNKPFKTKICISLYILHTQLPIYMVLCLTGQESSPVPLRSHKQNLLSCHQCSVVQQELLFHSDIIRVHFMCLSDLLFPYEGTEIWRGTWPFTVQYWKCLVSSPPQLDVQQVYTSWWHGVNLMSWWVFIYLTKEGNYLTSESLFSDICTFLPGYTLVQTGYVSIRM